MVYRMKISEFEHGLVPDSEGDLVDYGDYAALEEDLNTELAMKRVYIQQITMMERLYIQQITTMAAQLAEARELLCPEKDLMGNRTEEWLERRGAFLDSQLGEE